MAEQDFDVDDMGTYIDERPLTKQDIEYAGGYLKHWNVVRGRRPDIAAMGLDYLSAPGMSPFLRMLKIFLTL